MPAGKMPGACIWYSVLVLEFADMDISREMRVRMERAHVLAWPALNTADVDGWLWRCSGGGSQRANSVSTIDFGGKDMDAAVAAVEARYRAAEMPAQFQTFDDTSPAALVPLLRSRGYQQGEPTITMFRPVTMFRPNETASRTSDVEVRDEAWAEWLDVYMGAITASRRTVNRLILERIPAPRTFFGCRRDGKIVATGLCVAGHGCAVIECVATRADHRRQGAAQSVLQSILNWAGTQAVDLMGLQVVDTNGAAVTLYERNGFVAGATNRFWVLRARC
jgi:ribosomal protein S18 acetylase RimI-like enzyme